MIPQLQHQVKNEINRVAAIAEHYRRNVIPKCPAAGGTVAIMNASLQKAREAINKNNIREYAGIRDELKRYQSA
jgi:hypothetical protein